MRRRISNNLVDDYGTVKYEDMDRKIVMGIRDKKAATPAAANKVVDMIKCIYAWGLDQEIPSIEDLPTRNIKKLKPLRKGGYKIVGYGAAAKGMTFLNFADVRLDYIIDDNPLKQNLFTPGTNIEIKSSNFIKTYDEDDKILFVPLAWNFYEEIRSRILDVRQNEKDKFLKYFPSIKIEV